jgi:hypothetical protein
MEWISLIYIYGKGRKKRGNVKEKGSFSGIESKGVKRCLIKPK